MLWAVAGKKTGAGEKVFLFLGHMNFEAREGFFPLAAATASFLVGSNKTLGMLRAIESGKLDLQLANGQTDDC